MNFYLKCNVVVFIIFNVFLSIKTHASGLKGYYIIGQSSSVMVEGEYEVNIDVKKDFTAGDEGQVLFRTQVPRTTVILTNESGDIISLSTRSDVLWTLDATYSNLGTQYPFSSGTCHNKGGQYSITSFSLQFEFNGTCYYYNTRGADRISYNKISTASDPVLKHWDVVSPITSPGIYRGSVAYNLGPGKNFDMGPEAIYNTDRIEIPIEVHVSNLPLKVTFPPGAQHAVLAPQDGWSSWVGRGLTPSRIYRDIPFKVSAQGWVSVRLEECTYYTGRTCQISDGSGGLARLNVKMTLPEPWKGVDNANIIYMSSPSYISLTRFFSGLSPATSRGKLTVEVSGAELNKMMALPGSEWSGNITVVFETMI
ncbi:hypothetical protein M977_00208 [Buttiauxella gaviniae ATCC 51604]|uniref:Uncharacterized protein n=1 Tax=Buttiauxella gaviniae ATCC 51604 TaxID=1354253 RepID=A0A1B7I651_9ENTR|nr:hypothetical protein [Buttiauxella gaviniae]OAT23918.1 hypothetical protein M977_00208 [Buttiauxella gaviniae ATCC 51604]